FFFFFQAEDGIRDRNVTEFRRVLFRSYRETIGDVDLLVASVAAGPVMDALVRAPSVERVLAHGETKTSVIVARGLQIDLRVVPPDRKSVGEGKGGGRGGGGVMRESRCS